MYYTNLRLIKKIDRFLDGWTRIYRGRKCHEMRSRQNCRDFTDQITNNNASRQPCKLVTSRVFPLAIMTSHFSILPTGQLSSKVLQGLTDTEWRHFAVAGFESRLDLSRCAKTIAHTTPSSPSNRFESRLSRQSI